MLWSISVASILPTVSQIFGPWFPASTCTWSIWLTWDSCFPVTTEVWDPLRIKQFDRLGWNLTILPEEICPCAFPYIREHWLDCPSQSKEFSLPLSLPIASWLTRTWSSLPTGCSHSTNFFVCWSLLISRMSLVRFADVYLPVLIADWRKNRICGSLCYLSTSLN